MMTENEIGEILYRLTKLETLSTEKWNSHDQRSKELTINMKEGFDKIQETVCAVSDKVTGLALQLAKLPCDKSQADRSVIKEQIVSNKTQILALWGMLAVIVVAVFFMWLKQGLLMPIG